MNKKGFTLIELLAVIIILGILMIIAIPSVTKYINDSRKNSYIGTAKEMVAGARNMVNDGKLEMFDTGTTYYIDINCIKTENGTAQSPYGNFTKAYVAVTYDGKGYEYYWTSVDDAGEGIKNLIKYDNLDPDMIESDMTDSDISTLRGIDGRKQSVVVSKANGCKKEGSNLVEALVIGETGEIKDPVVYPEGKTKQTVTIGEIVKIGDEEFYVIGRNGSDLKLLAHYNLNVGTEYLKRDAPVGIQNPEVLGSYSGFDGYGMVAFSKTNYWKGKIGTDYPGIYCDSTATSSSKCAYVYDSNSYIYKYVEDYKEILEKKGAIIKEARLLKYEEAKSLGCGANHACTRAFLTETSYWLGTPISSEILWIVYRNGTFGHVFFYYYSSGYYGVRPVIVI